MKAPLSVRFNKIEIEGRCKSLAESTKLTKADIARAAMNKGLEWIEHNKSEMDLSDFEKDIKECQQ